jgi:hypothetical protein
LNDDSTGFEKTDCAGTTPGWLGPPPADQLASWGKRSPWMARSAIRAAGAHTNCLGQPPRASYEIFVGLRAGVSALEH